MLTRVLRQRGMRNGVLGGNRRWMTIWLVVVAGQTVHKLTKPKPVVEKFELQPGESIVVSDLGVSEREL